MSSELRALDAQIDDRLKRLERQSDDGRCPKAHVGLLAGQVWETCQDIRLFLKYRDEAQAKDRAPMELADSEWHKVWVAMSTVYHDPEHKNLANAARKWLAERSGG